MKRTFALLCPLLLTTAAHAAPLPGSILVEDPSGCLRKDLIARELGALLDEQHDYRTYSVDVTASAPGPDGSVPIELTVTGGETPLKRSLTIRKTECEDGARLLARIASTQLANAPKLEVLAKLGTPDAPPMRAPVVDRIPDEFIWFQRHTVVTVSSNRYGSNARVDEYEMPIVGPYKKEITWQEFYEKVGKPEMGAQFTRNVMKKIALYASGAGTVTLFPLVGALGLSGGLLAAFFGLLMVASSAAAGPLGIALLVGGGIASAVGLAGMVGGGIAGIVLIFVGNTIREQPIEMHEVRKLADEYNQKLPESPSEKAIQDALRDGQG